MSTKYIPDELIVEILKRLPVKSLLRFMSVSKAWHSLIKNPCFVSYHVNHQMNQGPRFLLYHDSDSYHYYVHSDNENFDMHLEFRNTNYCEYLFTWTRVACCNGIFCFMSKSYRKVKNTCFGLWNSFVRKSLDLKFPHCTTPSDEKRSACWFGFDEVSNDYKLVWVRYSTTPSREIRPTTNAYIYSVNDRAWRCVNLPFLPSDGSLSFRGVYLNGVIHWVFKRLYSYRSNNILYLIRYVPEWILTFSLADETFGVCKLPSEIVDVEPSNDRMVRDDFVELMTVKRGCKNCLVVVHGNITNFNFWVMEEEGVQASWTKDFSINRGDNTKILNARTNGEIVIMEPESGGVVSFDHKLMRMNRLSSVTSEHLNYAGTYMESLVLL